MIASHLIETIAPAPWTYDVDPDRMKLPPRQSRTFVAGNEHD